MMDRRVAKPEHEIAYQELCNLVNKHADKLSALELLAIAANMIGKLIALQDQRLVSPAQAMQVVSRNIEVGNRQALEQVSKSAGSA